MIETPSVPSSSGGRQGVPRWRRAPGQPGPLRGNPLLLAGGAVAVLIVVTAVFALPVAEMALGELEFQCGRHACAYQHFKVALQLARNPTEQRFMESRLNQVKSLGGCLDEPRHP